MDGRRVNNYPAKNFTHTHVVLLKETLETDDYAETGYFVKVNKKYADEIKERKKLPVLSEKQTTKKLIWVNSLNICVYQSQKKTTW